MAAPPINTPQVEEVFKNSALRAQAEHPDTLERLGPQWSAFLAGKGQGLKTYLEDLQLAYKMLRDPHFQISKETKTILIIALLYVISPIDLIPDAIPGEFPKPDDQRSQHPSRVVGVVALQGVRGPGDDRGLQLEHGGHAALDIAAPLGLVERLPGGGGLRAQ